MKANCVFEGKNIIIGFDFLTENAFGSIFLKESGNITKGIPLCLIFGKKEGDVVLYKMFLSKISLIFRGFADKERRHL